MFCPAILTTTVTGLAQCSDGTGAAVAFVQTVPFDISQLDSGALGVAFGVGFTLIGTSWFIGKAAGTILRFIKGI